MKITVTFDLSEALTPKTPKLLGNLTSEAVTWLIESSDESTDGGHWSIGHYGQEVVRIEAYYGSKLPESGVFVVETHKVEDWFNPEDVMSLTSTSRIECIGFDNHDEAVRYYAAKVVAHTCLLLK